MRQGLQQTHLNVFKLVIMRKVTPPFVPICLIRNSARSPKSLHSMSAHNWTDESTTSRNQVHLRPLNVLTCLDCPPGMTAVATHINTQECQAFSLRNQTDFECLCSFLLYSQAYFIQSIRQRINVSPSPLIWQPAHLLPGLSFSC